MSGLIDPNEFEPLAPAGFYIAIRVGFAFPMVEHNHLPAGWVREYTVSGLIVHDPAMAWAYKNCGVARWSELGEDDTQGVLELAKNHGLNFGAVASCVDRGRRRPAQLRLLLSDRIASIGRAELERLNAGACRSASGACATEEPDRRGTGDVEPGKERSLDERNCLLTWHFRKRH